MYGCIYSKRLRNSGQNSLQSFIQVPPGLQSWAETLNKSQLMKLLQVVRLLLSGDRWGGWEWCHSSDATQHQFHISTDQETTGAGWSDGHLGHCGDREILSKWGNVSLLLLRENYQVRTNQPTNLRSPLYFIIIITQLFEQKQSQR